MRFRIRISVFVVIGLALFAVSAGNATPITYQGVFTGLDDSGGGFDRLGIAANTDTMTVTW